MNCSHPDAVLVPDGGSLPSIPAVDHYAGSEKLMRKALALQAERANRGVASFDVTFDCEDGAAVGAEQEHAEHAFAMLLMSVLRTALIVSCALASTTLRIRHGLRKLQYIVAVAGTRVSLM